LIPHPIIKYFWLNKHASHLPQHACYEKCETDRNSVLF
jgi:hypothetical protein